MSLDLGSINTVAMFCYWLEEYEEYENDIGYYGRVDSL